MLENKTISIISCVKKKQDGCHPAKKLYTSTLFNKSYKIAKKLSDEVFILSAEHGLIEEDKQICFYDKTLNSISKKEYIDWCKKVEQQASKKIKNCNNIYIFSGEKYRKPIEVFSSKHSIDYYNFLGNRTFGGRLSFLKSIESRYKEIRAVYSILEHKQKAQSLFIFNDLPKISLPKRGVYVFLDPNEDTIYSNILPRIVRIGTHAVSNGSKSTIRQRLIAHYGTQSSSGGNHRSSVFRKHIGTALLKGKFSDKRLNSWGKGSNAKKDIKDKEEWLELKVSSEIRKLWCCVFEIDDMPSKNSKRSTIEKLLINLLSNSNIDLISKNWLGKNSDSKEIMNTGLWNIQYSSGEISQEKINFLLDYLWKNYK